MIKIVSYKYVHRLAKILTNIGYINLVCINCSKKISTFDALLWCHLVNCDCRTIIHLSHLVIVRPLIVITNRLNAFLQDILPIIKDSCTQKIVDVSPATGNFRPPERRLF